MIYPWQKSAWNDLMTLRANLPHALLLYGQAGIGKKDFALHFSQALLCESPLEDGQACDKCVACTWFRQSNHPDFRLIRPESMGDVESLSSAEKNSKAESAGDEGEKKTKAASKEIKVEQIRELLNFVNIGTHRSGLKVIVIYPLEALNAVAANALLKTLEEPPPGTVFLLVADRTAGILPTILSRCRLFAMPRPNPAIALDWLKGQGVEHASELLAEYGGAPLAALQAGDSEEHSQLQILLKHLSQGPKMDWLSAAEPLQKLPFPLILGVMQRWLYDINAYQLAQKIRYYPQHQEVLKRCAKAAKVEPLLRFQKLLIEQRRTENHPIAAKLSIESLFLYYKQLFSANKP